MTGLLLYGLQTASLNLRQMQLDPFKKERIVVNPGWVRETGAGDDAWCEEDFDDEDEEASEDEEDADAEGESNEETIDAENEFDEEDDGGEHATFLNELENADDGADQHSANREANSPHRPVRVARATSRRHAAPKRSRTCCTDPYEDDDHDLDQNAVRALFEMLQLPVDPPEKKPPMPETQDKPEAQEKNDTKKMSS
jgi:hypothetical protein